MTPTEPFGSDQDRIDLQASEWVVLRSDRELSREEECDFDAWLSEDPRHHVAWQEFSATWATIPALPSLADLAPIEDDNGEHDRQPGASRGRFFRRGAAALAAIAAVFFGIFLLPSLQERDEHYQTGISQTQLLTLADGSQVTLGPRSNLSVKFVKGERRVTLASGEAFFEVVHDKTRPFLVEAGGATTRVLGTKFDVNYGVGSVRVGVLEGVVQVRRSEKDAKAGVAYLRAGQGAEVTLSGSKPIRLLAAQAPGAWREGRLVYEDSRLADIAADVNRYYPPGVVLADPSLANLRITASFKPSEIAAVMSAIGNVVPVKATEAADGSFRLESTSK